MPGAGRGRAAAAALVVLALSPACSAVAGPSAPRTPAPVQQGWPGCVAVGAFEEDARGEGPHGVGGVPEGFAPTTAVICTGSERTDAAGNTVGVGLERTATDVGPLLTYLAQPDERAGEGACPAIGFLPPWLFLLDGDGRYVAPVIPRDACGLPIGWSGRPVPWESLRYRDRVVRQGPVVESAEARQSGCAMGYKDVVDTYAASSHVRPGGVGEDVFHGRTVSVCVYEVAAADRGTDTPAGSFVSGHRLDARGSERLADALRAAPATPARCSTANARFAVLDAGDDGRAYAELDGCRRVVVEGETTPVVHADDALVALLTG